MIVAASFEQPGAKGPKVYEWEEVRSGVWLRRHVPRAEVMDRWPPFADSQKRYDSSSNDRDLCEAFESLATPAEVESDEEEEDANPLAAPRVNYVDHVCSGARSGRLIQSSSGAIVKRVGYQGWMLLSTVSNVSREHFASDLRQYHVDEAQSEPLSFDSIYRLVYIQYGYCNVAYTEDDYKAIRDLYVRDRRKTLYRLDVEISIDKNADAVDDNLDLGINVAWP